MHDFYEFRGEPAVSAYLREHRQVAPALLDAIGLLRSVYGPAVSAALEVEVNWQDESAPPLLFALVQVARDSDSAFDQMETFLKQWVESTPPSVGKWLNFGSDYRLPAA